MTLLVAVPVIIHSKADIIGEPEDHLLLVLRGVGAMSIITALFAVKYIPVGEATAIFFSAPLFTLIFGKIFLNEVFGKYELLMLILTLGGVVAVVNPLNFINDIAHTSVENQVIGCSIAILTAVLMAVAAVVLRKLKHVPFIVLVFWGAVSIGILSILLIFALDDYSLPVSKEDYMITLGAAITGCIANFLFTLAVRFASAGSVLIVKSSEVIFAAVYQMFLFSDPLTTSEVVGAILICTSVILLNRKQWIMEKLKSVDEKIPE